MERTVSLADIIDLKRQRKDLFEKARTGREDAREAKDETQETNARITAMLDNVDKLTARIDEEERMLAVQDTMKDWEDKRQDESGNETARLKAEAFRDFLVHGEKDMQPEHRALGLTTSDGGYIVPQDFWNQLVDIMKAYGGMRQGATVITTSGGNELLIPKGDDTGNTGEIVGEFDTVNSNADPVLTQMSLKAYSYSSKIVLVGRALLQDQAVNLEALLANWLAIRIGRITNTHFTTGDDTNKPEGILDGAVDSTITSDKQTSVVYADLVSLMHSIDPAYQATGSWMFSDSTLSMLKKMVTGSEKIPLWLPGMAAREPDTILGKRYIVNQDMPAHTTGLKSILFGDVSQYWIRDVAGATLMRLTERYADKLQVGFMLFSRHDGGLAVPAAVKYYTVGAD